MTKEKRKKLLLLDGNAILHRAFHAIPPLQTQTGLSINAVYGFTATFLNVLEKFQPDYIITTFDSSKKTFRNEKFSEYKANRKETDEDLIPQFSLVRKLVKSFNVTFLEKENYEADDLIGTLARLASEKNLETIIVTGDKDTLQLVNDKVQVFTMSKGIKDMVLYNREMVKEKTGIFPEQITDFKGLRGDSSDNIPGVKGVGEKTALDLLQQYGSLENVYKNLSEIKESLRKKLEESKEMAFLSKDLGTIFVDVPLEFNWEETKSDKISYQGAKSFFQEYEFKSLLKRLPKDKITQTGFDFYNTQDDKKLNSEKEKEKITFLNYNNFLNFYPSFFQEEIIFYLDYENDIFYGMGFLFKEKLFYLEFKSENFNFFQQILENEAIKKIGFDIKKSLHILTKNNLTLNKIESDVLLETYVCRAGKKIDLNDLIFEITGRLTDFFPEKSQMMMNLRDNKKAQKEVCQKAKDISIIHQFFQKEMETISLKQNEKNNVKTLLRNLELPLIKVLFKMEEVGIAFDKNIFQEISTNFQKQIQNLEEEIYLLAEGKFNINSTQQLRVILFDKLKIDTKEVSKTKTGLSTASSELEKLRDKHPIIAKIEEYRELFKLKTTYIDTLPKLVDKKNRLHSTFNQAVTATGRLSSSDPNLQNIPIRTETGRQLRKAFVAEKKYKLLSIDYSQIDLRCVAHVSQDENLIKAFQENLDIHSFTASQVWGKNIAEISKEERRSAKELNFGLIYGMGTFGFSRSAGISTEEAKVFIKNYFEKFPKVKNYIEQTKKHTQESGYVETIFGRLRFVPEINSKNFQLKASGERMAINMPIQGLTADIMKLAMISIDDYLQKKYSFEKVRMILQVHDEIILEVEENLVEKLSLELKEIMEKIVKLSVPLIANVKVGNNWGEL